MLHTGELQLRQRLHHDFNTLKLKQLKKHAYTVWINMDGVEAKLTIRLRDSGDVVTMIVPPMTIVVFRDDVAHAGAVEHRLLSATC